MGFLIGIVQVLVFLALVKAGHIGYWNLKKAYYVHPWLLETVLAILLVSLFHIVSSVWALVIIVSLAIGLIRGDQEAKSGTTRQLL